MNKHNKTDSCVLTSYLFNKDVPDSEIVKGFSIREIHYCLLVWIEYKNKIYDKANIQFVQNPDMNILSLPQYSMEKPNHLKKMDDNYEECYSQLQKFETETYFKNAPHNVKKCIKAVERKIRKS